ncbi:3-dehydroquinate synthase [Clostridium homopropionicum DSM 5847]|uniref:3-dehydroquinate synthase n=1 Tax=Clostridium homopropionicum DSM 5847 TaxID=1121318 RepID=A0A0L6Z8B0_9CLOT|nr:3-dehydroquinate synthase [Clostridium homopropionicum]KOA19202.1 3-dehydroquinate synthase [Clostridium homopropionicum DSM 5847]SFG17255.1 3-dehydroquinate synthase [Clostridium homopropionicum]
MSNFHVELKKVIDDSYDVEIGFNLINKMIEDLKNGLVKGINKFAIITDSEVEKLYANKVYEQIKNSGLQADLFMFPAGEKNKTRRTKEFIEDSMLEKSYRRDCCIIAVGGGVVTDLAGFVAGTYGRGVPFINFATTHLAAADASIGGKTAVDTDLATNLIGLINQPVKVYIDIAAWKTLPKRQLISGLAETIKHACIADKSFFEFIENNLESILNCNFDACEHIAKRNCEIKYNVVMNDEKEKSLREILNLGHTVGRAIETVSDYKLLHGEALSIGIVAQVNLGNKLGYINDEDRDRVITLLERACLPITIPDYIDLENLIKKLYTDKKVRDGKIRFVFQKGIGDVQKFGNDIYAIPIDESEIKEILEKM